MQWSTIRFRLAGIGFEPAINAVAAFGKGVCCRTWGASAVYLAQVLDKREDTTTTADVKLQLDAERRGMIASQALGYVSSLM